MGAATFAFRSMFSCLSEHFCNDRKLFELTPATVGTAGPVDMQTANAAEMLLDDRAVCGL